MATMPGVRVAHVCSVDTEVIVDALARQFAGSRPELLLWFASSEVDFPALARALQQHFEGSVVVGCTTSGEIGPEGCTTGSVVALAMDAPSQARAVLLEDLDQPNFDARLDAIATLIEAMGERPDSLAQHGEDFVFLTLVDGLSGAEEQLLAAISTVAPGVALVGGSAGDDFGFRRTQVAVGERAASGAAAIVLLAPRRPFAPVHLHHFRRAGAPMVVTEADPGKRLVTRIDGISAIAKLAAVLEVDEDQLRADPVPILSRAPLVFGVTVGDQVFLRSAMNLRDDAVLMGGALEEGTIVHPMRPGDLIEDTRSALAAALTQVARPQSLLLFNCGGRIWEARSRGQVAELGAAMLPLPGAGFTTYGEQYGSAQLNHTLTGLVFGDLQ